MATPKNPNPFPIVRPDRSSIHPSHLPPPSRFWSTLSVASTLVFIISLCTINSFKSLSYFYTVPIILHLLYLTSRLYPLLFSRLHSFPKPRALTLGLVECAVLILCVLSFLYPDEDSLPAHIFFVAVAVNAMAIAKLIKGWRKGRLFQHLMVAAVFRAARMWDFDEVGFINYLYTFLYACLAVLLFYFDITDGSWGDLLM